MGFGVMSVLITDILTVGTTDFGNNMDVWKGEEKGELWGSGWYSSYIEPGKAQKFDDVWWSLVGFQLIFFWSFQPWSGTKKNMAIFRGDIPGQGHRSDIQDAGGSPAENNSRFGWSFTLPLFVQYHCSIKHIMLTIIKHQTTTKIQWFIEIIPLSHLTHTYIYIYTYTVFTYIKYPY